MPTYEVHFYGHKVDVLYEDQEVAEMLEFMFKDQVNHPDAKLETVFEVAWLEEKKQWALKDFDEVMNTGQSLNEVANVLMDEAIFHLISSNKSEMAIHAGLVSDDEGAILLPANSGSGKSSVTSWLTKQGWHYHTDELVLLDLESFALKAFTRPVKIKKDGMQPIKDLIPIGELKDQIRFSSIAVYIPHRLLNPEFKREIPPLKAIVFPQYRQDCEPGLSPLSPAEAGLEMMRSNVIARNLPNHGFSDITKLVRSVSAYRLHYNHFDNLNGLFEHLI